MAEQVSIVVRPGNPPAVVVLLTKVPHHVAWAYFGRISVAELCRGPARGRNLAAVLAASRSRFRNPGKLVRVPAVVETSRERPGAEHRLWTNRAVAEGLAASVQGRVAGIRRWSVLVAAHFIRSAYRLATGIGRPRRPADGYLDIVAELGIAGLAINLMLLFVSWRNAVRLLKFRAYRDLGLFLLAFTFMIVLINASESFLHDIEYYPMIVFLVCSLFVSHRLAAASLRP